MKDVKRFTIAMACLASFLGMPASAASWVYVTTGTSNTSHYYEVETIHRSGTQVTFWEKRDHSRDKTLKERENRVRLRVNCTETTYAILNGIRYFPNGKIETVDIPAYLQEENVVAPETTGEAMLKAVCAATAPE